MKGGKEDCSMSEVTNLDQKRICDISTDARVIEIRKKDCMDDVYQVSKSAMRNKIHDLDLLLQKQRRTLPLGVLCILFIPMFAS
jgi:hypothetical protein